MSRKKKEYGKEDWEFEAIIIDVDVGIATNVFHVELYPCDLWLRYNILTSFLKIHQ